MSGHLQLEYGRQSEWRNGKRVKAMIVLVLLVTFAGLTFGTYKKIQPRLLYLDFQKQCLNYQPPARLAPFVVGQVAANYLGNADYYIERDSTGAPARASLLPVCYQKLSRHSKSNLFPGGFGWMAPCFFLGKCKSPDGSDRLIYISLSCRSSCLGGAAPLYLQVASISPGSLTTTETFQEQIIDIPGFWRMLDFAKLQYIKKDNADPTHLIFTYRLTNSTRSPFSEERALMIPLAETTHTIDLHVQNDGSVLSTIQQAEQ